MLHVILKNGELEKKVKGERECRLSTFIIDKSRSQRTCNATEVPDCSLHPLWQSERRAEIGESGPHAGATAHRCWCICVSAGHWASFTHAPARWADAEDKTAGLLLAGKNNAQNYKKIGLGVRILDLLKAAIVPNQGRFLHNILKV